MSVPTQIGNHSASARDPSIALARGRLPDSATQRLPDPAITIQQRVFGSGKWMTWLVLTLIFASALPLSVRLWGQLWNSDQYSFFPVICLSAGLIAYLRSGLRIRTHAILQPAGLFWLITSIFCIAAAAVFRSPWLGWLAMLLVLRAASNLLFELPDTKSLLGPWLLLWITLPLPFGIDTKLVVALQKYSSSTASTVLDAFGIPNVLSGVMIRTPQRSYLVETACSGINSFYAALALVGIYVIWQRYSPLRSIGLLMAAAFWTIVFNTFRVIAIVYADARGYGRLDEGMTHEILGMVTFTGAILATFSTNAFANYLFPSRTDTETVGIGFFDRMSRFVHTELTPQPIWNIGFGLTLLALIVGLGSVGYANRTTFQPARGVAVDNFSGVLPSSWSGHLLPTQLEGWTQVGFKNVERNPRDPFGANSLIWEYRNGLLSAEVSIDGPYGAWHDLWYCYSGVNWELRSAEVTELQDARSVKLPFTHLWMNRGELEEAHVWFFCVDSVGNSVQPPPPSNTVYRTILNRLRRQGGQQEPTEGPVYQCQVIMHTIASPLPAELDLVQDLAASVGSVLQAQLEPENRQ